MFMIRKMILNIALLSLMTFISCQNDYVQSEGKSNVTLTIDISGGSRTQTDELGKVAWSEGDQYWFMETM